MLVYESAYAVALQLAVFVLEVVFVFYIINTHDRPSMKLNWIIAILVAPVFGVPMYLFNGRGRPTRKMREKIVRAKRENDEKAKETITTGLMDLIGDLLCQEESEGYTPRVLNEMSQWEKERLERILGRRITNEAYIAYCTREDYEQSVGLRMSM